LKEKRKVMGGQAQARIDDARLEARKNEILLRSSSLPGRPRKSTSATPEWMRVEALPEPSEAPIVEPVPAEKPASNDFWSLPDDSDEVSDRLWKLAGEFAAKQQAEENRWGRA
jgi:hypothetical protein